MDRLSREFTPREKVLLLILAILLVVVVYYYLVDIPLRSQKETLTAQKEQLTVDYETTHARYLEYLKMAEDMERVTADTSIMASYNNRLEEIDFLDDLFSKSRHYSVGFSPVTVEGNQIRRAFSVTYNAASYDKAIKILKKLAECKYRCVINDISVSGNGGRALEGPVTVSCGATFFETMVERDTDAGLPETEATPTTEE